MADITMPQLGETVTEGTITRWLKNVGDAVAEDEVLFEVSTDKVDSEVPSPAAGVLTEILVPEGETVDVGTRLAVVSPEGAGAEAGSDGDSAGGSAGPAASGGPRPDLAPAEAAPESEPVAEPEARPPAAASASAPEEPAPPFESAPPTAASSPPQAPPSSPPPPTQAQAGAGDGLLLSPVVRRLISEHGLDPSNIKGTGQGGRITREDVLAVIDRRSQEQPAAPPAARGPAPAVSQEPLKVPAPLVRAEGERDTVVPFTNIRRRTAEHMVRSKQTSAHTMVAFEVDYTSVEQVRAQEKDRWRQAEGFSLNYLPFVSRAVVDAIADFPHVNSSVGDDELIVHHDVNLGIAVDLDFEGLLVPVIHQADSKRMRALAREISDLASRARAKRLTMDDISGGTFTITNAGPFGTFLTVPVINQPQVAILSTDGVRKRPVAIQLPDGTDAIAVRPVGNLVLSWDHRAFDGAYAAAFVAAVKRIVETRDWSAEL